MHAIQIIIAIAVVVAQWPVSHQSQWSQVGVQVGEKLINAAARELGQRIQAAIANRPAASSTRYRAKVHGTACRSEMRRNTVTKVRCAGGPNGYWDWLHEGESGSSTPPYYVRGDWVSYEEDGSCDTVFAIKGIEYNKLIQRCIINTHGGFTKVAAGETASTLYDFLIIECYLKDYRKKLPLNPDGRIVCPSGEEEEL